MKLAAFPRDLLIERELFAGTVSEVDLLAALGAPSGESVPALGAGHPTFFWDLTYGCGLVMGLQFDQLTQRLSGFLDAPDVDHALRHLGVPMADRWLLEESDPDLFRAVAPPTDARCGVAAIVDGRRRTVAEGLTERDARCRCTMAPGEPLVLLVDGEVVDLRGPVERQDADGRPLAPPPVASGDRLAGALAARMVPAAPPAPPPAPPPPLAAPDLPTPPPAPSPPVSGRPPADRLPSSFDPGRRRGTLETFDDDEFESS